MFTVSATANSEFLPFYCEDDANSRVCGAYHRLNGEVFTVKGNVCSTECYSIADALRAAAYLTELMESYRANECYSTLDCTLTIKEGDTTVFNF